MHYRNLALFLILAAVWGSAFVAIKAGLGTPTNPGYFFEAPVLFAAARYDIAGILMFAFAVWATPRWRPRSRTEWVSVFIAATLLIAAYHAFLFIGETNPSVTSAGAAVIVSLSPVLTTAFARGLLPAERLTAVGVLGLILGLLGVGILSNPDPSNLLTAGVLAKVTVFLAAVSFALGSVLLRRINDGLPIETLEAWAMLGGAAMLHLASVGLGEDLPGTPNASAIAALAYLSVVASAGGFLVYFVLLERLGPIEINLVSYVAPIFAAVVGFVLLGEVVTIYTGIGFLVIVVGFILLKRQALRRELPTLRKSWRQD